MFNTLLAFHSLFRWLVVISLVYAIVMAIRGWRGQLNFTPLANRVRHWTATIAHVQLALGLWVYFKSPTVAYFMANFQESVKIRNIRFFGMEHSLMMVLAVVAVTVGSMRAKRKTEAKDKFKAMAIWFLIAFVIIFINIPWPFSPFAARPFFRPF